jgi:hypothetical protein
MKNLGKDMKMKTPVEMMNSMASRMTPVVVLLGVGLVVGTVSSRAEELLFQKIIDRSIKELVKSTSEYYEFNRNRLVELGSVSLTSEEELNYTKHYIQTEKFVPTDDDMLNNLSYINNLYFEGMILLTVKFAEFSHPIEIVFNNPNIVGSNSWKILDSGAFVGGVFPIKGPAVVKVSVIPYTMLLRDEPAKKWKIFFPKQNWRVFFNKTMATYAKSSGQQQVLVLPKGSGVNELVLESSEDLVNWEKDSLGDKNTDAANRFYRLRAVKK